VKFLFFCIALTGTSTPPPENVTPAPVEETSATNKQADKVVKVDPLLESKLLECLCNPSLTFPVDSVQLTSSLSSKVHAHSSQIIQVCFLSGNATIRQYFYLLGNPII